MPTLPEVPDGPTDSVNTTTVVDPEAAAALTVEAGVDSMPEDAAEQCNAELKAAEDQVEAAAELVNEQMVSISTCSLLHIVPVSGFTYPPSLSGRELDQTRLS
jgi:hypothetical protein